MNKYPTEKIDDLLVKMGVKNQVFYTSILPSFTFDKKTKKVVPYHAYQTNDNELIVLHTICLFLINRVTYIRSINRGIS